MERIRRIGSLTRTALALAVPTLALLMTQVPAEAQFGDPQTYVIRVVDQDGRPLDGSMVRVEGTTGDLITPATVQLNPGPQLVTIEPAAQGAMLAGGSARPTAPNGLSRNEFIFFDMMGGEVSIEWRTAEVQISIDDQDGAAIAGARWGLAGDGASFAPGTILLPVTDESLYSTLNGGSVDGWQLEARAAFDGAPVDLLRGTRFEAMAGPATLSLGWQQLACTMGVVDGSGTPIRGATWTILGHTFNAGDPITLPITDESIYPDLSGSLAAGFTASLFTNTASGSGDATFEVIAGAGMVPALVDVNGSSFGLRCGVSPFPPITTGTVVVSVSADGAPFAGAQVTLVDVNGGASILTTGADGQAQQADVPQGAATLTLALPSGYVAVDPASATHAISVVAEGTVSASFTMAQDAPPPPPPPAVNNPETANYWKREVNAALRGHGRSEESLEDMAFKYPEAIFVEFAQHPTDPVRVEGVTEKDPDGAGPKIPRRLTLSDMDATFDASNGSALAAARRELLVVLLNVVSGRLSLHLVVDGQGTTLEQEIRRLAALINDGQPGNDPFARERGRQINAGRAGMGAPTYRTHEDTAFDAALDGGDTDGLALTATRNAGVAGIRLSFTLASPQRATLDVFDASGRRLARLHEGDAPSGTTTVTWTPAGSRPGIYFARLVTAEGIRSAKVIAGR